MKALSFSSAFISFDELAAICPQSATARGFAPVSAAASPAATSPPDEVGADCVIPDDAEQRPGEPGEPPPLIGLIQPGGDVDIGESPNAAPQRETPGSQRPCQAPGIDKDGK